MKKTTISKIEKAIEKWEKHPDVVWCFNIENIIYLRDSHPDETERFYLETHFRLLSHSIRVGIRMTRDHKEHLKEMMLLHLSR